jgi:hypothetical protein
MASISKVTKTRRRKKQASNGRKQKRARTKAGTPKFPIHPEQA